MCDLRRYLVKLLFILRIQLQVLYSWFLVCFCGIWRLAFNDTVPPVLRGRSKRTNCPWIQNIVDVNVHTHRSVFGSCNLKKDYNYKMFRKTSQEWCVIWVGRRYGQRHTHVFVMDCVWLRTKGIQYRPGIILVGELYPSRSLAPKGQKSSLWSVMVLKAASESLSLSISLSLSSSSHTHSIHKQTHTRTHTYIP